MVIDTRFLEALLSQPTAPFRETLVMKVLIDYCKKHRISHFRDPVGNLVVGVRNERDYLTRVKKKTRIPLRIFMAHTDHPGFHGVAWKDSKHLFVKWFGGSPRKHLAGTAVWLATKTGFETTGVLRSVILNQRGSAISEGIVELEKAHSVIEAKELYGGFRFRKPVWTQGELIYTKAADDLIGSFAIVTLARSFEGDSSFLGILTRAEEVGFIGAIGHFELGWLEKARRELLCISLETSRTLPGAEIGKGPVVRLGDRMTLFDPGGMNILWELAQNRLKGNYQRRIMDGGACEASASTAYGLRSVGISVPLGNYHNQSLQGGPDSRGVDGPAPEFVHRKDLIGLLTLCRVMMDSKIPLADPWKKRREEFSGMFKGACELLGF